MEIHSLPFSHLICFDNYNNYKMYNVYLQFSCDHFPDVQSGALKFDDEREKFMGHLDNHMVPSPKGFVNRATFIDMYEDLNGSFPTENDDYFNFMVYIHLKAFRIFSFTYSSISLLFFFFLSQKKQTV